MILVQVDRWINWQICKQYGKMERNNDMSNMTSKDKDGRILVNEEFKICNRVTDCSGSSCHESCVINLMIRRLYELEHKERE